MNLFVSEESLIDTIAYFNEADFGNKAVQLGMFFFFKAIGFNNRETKPYPKVSQQSQDQKDFFNGVLYKLGGIYTISEIGGKRSCLFPFTITDNMKVDSFFNGGSAFKQLLSRMRDTIDNTLVDIFLDKGEDESLFKFKRNYIKIIQNNYLPKNKISKVFFAAWLSRFTKIEVPCNISSQEFTRICVKDMEDFLNLNREELDELFEDDTKINSLTYEKTVIPINVFRGLFSFYESPEIITGGNDINLSENTISLDRATRFIEVTDVNPSLTEIKDLLLRRKQIILFGVPGVGKSKLVDELKGDYDEVKLIQFHANTTYEGFIVGTTIENNSLTEKPGVFLEFCYEAQNNPDKRYLFVIDEINRGNISKIFGETILALDREYCVDLSISVKIGEKQVDSFSIPDNFYIIGTMNSADRSIAVVDYAIRRRFGFVKLVPNYEIIGQLSETSNVQIDIEKLYRIINDKILKSLKDENLLLGQSYFIPKWITLNDGKIEWTPIDLRLVFNYSIIPMIEEYCYGSVSSMIEILGDKLPSRIPDDIEFLVALKETYPEAVL